MVLRAAAARESLAPFAVLSPILATLVGAV
jgi:hypothetical protein